MGIDQTRDKIVSVADKLFGRFGFQRTSMDEIAKISRKAKGSLYYHFSSKEKLFREVVQNEVNELKAKLLDVVNSNVFTCGGKLQKYMLTRMELMQHATNYLETIQPGDFDYFEFLDDIRRDLDAWEKERLITILNEGVERGEFDIKLDTEILSDMFIMIVKGLEVPFFIQGKYEQYLPHLDEMAKIFIKGLK